MKDYATTESNVSRCFDTKSMVECLQELKRQYVEMFGSRTSQSIVVTHPDNLAELKRLFSRDNLGVAVNSHFEDVQIVGDPCMHRWVQEYVPPVDRHIEYEESDYEWLQFFGYGHWRDTKQMLFYQADMRSGTPFGSYSYMTTRNRLMLMYNVL